MAAPRGADGAWALADPWPPWLDEGDGGEEEGEEEGCAGGEPRDGAAGDGGGGHGCGSGHAHGDGDGGVEVGNGIGGSRAGG
jgi:hypothetical protein